MFNNILGHKTIQSGLLHAVGTGRLHHALLFCGKKGVGKSMVAQSLAQILMCKESVVGNGVECLKQCEKCKNCIRIANETHPDFLHVRLEDRASISIEKIREIQQQVTYEPFESEIRVVIVEDAHTMQEPAANALLKTLEEPSTKTLFILITDQEQRLLPTIVSRCQVLRFASFSESEVLSFLLARGFPQDKAEWIATLADGSFADALAFADGAFSEGILDLFESILAMNHESQIFNIAEKMLPKSESTAKKKAKTDSDLESMTTTSDVPKRAKDSAFLALIVLLTTYLRDVYLLKFAQEPNLIFSQRKPEMKLRAQRVSIEDLNRAIQYLRDAPQALLENANPTLMCERLLLQMRGVFY